MHYMQQAAVYQTTMSSVPPRENMLGYMGISVHDAAGVQVRHQAPGAVAVLRTALLPKLPVAAAAAYRRGRCRTCR